MDELKEIKKLFKLMLRENLYELNVEEENFKVAIKRKTKTKTKSNSPADNIDLREELSQKQTPAQSFLNVIPPDYVKIASPINGVFYRAPSPDAASFVDIGSTVRKGGTVCIVEAMKLMNEIQAERDCKIVNIMVENSAIVTAGQVLFLAEEV